MYIAFLAIVITILPEKLPGPRLVKKYPAFFEIEGSSPYSQVSASCPCSKPDKSGPCPPSQFMKIHF
jgi:hypothetical protein